MKRNLTKYAYVIASNAKQVYAGGASANFYCDGVEDDVQINAALANYNKVVLSDGIFNIGKTLKGAGSLIGQGFNLTRIHGIAGLSSLIEIGGSRTQISGDGIIPSLNAGTSQIKSNINLNQFINPKDRLLLACNQIYNPIRGQYTTAEDIIVAKSDTNLLFVSEGLEFDYVNAENIFTRLYKYNLSKNISVGGFGLYLGIDTDNNNQTFMLRVKYTENAKINDILIDGNIKNGHSGVGCSLLECFDSRIENCTANYIFNKGNKTPTGYGFYIEGGRYNTVSNVKGFCKHLFDCDKQNWMSYARDIAFERCTVGSQGNEGTNNRPFSLHGGAKRVKINQCKQIITKEDKDKGLHIGFISRAIATEISNCAINAVIDNVYCASPFYIGENIATKQGGIGMNGDGKCCEDLKIENNIVSITRLGGGSFTAIEQGNFIQLKTNAINVSIKNNQFTGLQNTGILIQGNQNENIDITDNIFNFNGQLSDQKIAYIVPQNGNYGANKIKFKKNTIKGVDKSFKSYVESTTLIKGYEEVENKK